MASKGSVGRRRRAASMQRRLVTCRSQNTKWAGDSIAAWLR